ncbi:DUF3560 domain-containing protein [Dinghuibacter silviterrae]|uniref:Uncharacterized protein DUF3560 n=1 Tax=Dinghuibacter silviterrae TaxID=1539049 RepID=A0A4R8DRC1_9BACT|nr:DUF3560 domain-containing protein [Dinghuibacter silviterrae]TDX00519.1 uncharacterized protein DUF3560 [Dinghuibacter silviterrae]
MEGDNYYVHNQETGKLNVYTTKAFYDGLADDQKKIFSRFCLWSRVQGCWISKGKAEGCYYLREQIKALGFVNKGEVGERITFDEQVARTQERAEYRAERAEHRADKAEQKSDQLYNTAQKMASVIPFGQPILVGHHSEQRDRNYRNRIHNTFGKAFEELDKGKHYREKAATAKETAEGKKYSNPEYLTNRIKECQKHLRILDRRLNGKLYPNSPEQEISEQARQFYNNRIAEENEKLEFFKGKMKAINPAWCEPSVSTRKIKGKKNTL